MTNHETFSLTLRAELQRANLNRDCCGDCRRNQYDVDSFPITTSAAAMQQMNGVRVRDRHR